MSNYNFLKTGHSLLEDDSTLDEGYLKMITSLLKMFQEDSLITAGKYTIGCGRRNVTATDIKKALMFQAQNFFDQDGSFEERFEKYMNEEEESEGEEESGEESEGEEESGEESGGEEESGEEGENDVEDEELKLLVKNMDDIYKKWNEWNPTDPIQALIKKSIDSVSVE